MTGTGANCVMAYCRTEVVSCEICDRRLCVLEVTSLFRDNAVTLYICEFILCQFIYTLVCCDIVSHFLPFQTKYQIVLFQPSHLRGSSQLVPLLGR